MGVPSFGSSCGCTTIVVQPTYKKFEILEVCEIRGYTILKILYPECKNYEGVKILVYRSAELGKIRLKENLDPHFCDNHSSPIARFVPTDEGMKMAKIFVKAICK